MHTFYSVELESNSYQDDVCCGTYEECLAYLTEHDCKSKEDNGYVNRIAKFSTNSVDDSDKEYVLSSSEYDSFLKDHGLDFDEDFLCEEIIEDWAEDAEIQISLDREREAHISHADTNITPAETDENKIDSEMEDFDLHKDEWKFTAFHFYVRPLEGENAKDNTVFEAEREQVLNNLKMLIASQNDSAEALAHVVFNQAVNEFKEFTAQNPNILTEFGVSYANAYDKPDSPSGNITLAQSKNGEITYNNEYGIDKSLFVKDYAVDILKENISAIEREREAHMNAPLILHDGQTARSLGEAGLKDFRESHKENRACAEAIIAAKNENTTYGDMPGVCYFDAAKTVDDVLKKGFPAERLGYVIASQVVRDQNYLDNPRIIDGRFTNQVKDWAIKLFSQQENFPFRNFEGCDITSAMHHTLVNSLAESFIDKQAELSKAAEKKPSVLDKADKTQSIFEKKESISVEIGGESVLCEIIANNRFLSQSQNLGKAVFPNSNDHRDYAMVNVEIPDKDGAPEVIRLYAECNIEDVPGEGHFENKKGVCDRNADGAKFVIDDEEASDKFLLVALEKCAEKVAAERGIEVPYRAPTMTEKKPSVLGKIQKIKSEQKAREAAAPQKKEKSKSNNQEL